MAEFLIKSKMVFDDNNGPCYVDDYIELFEGSYNDVKTEIINRINSRDIKEKNATNTYDLVGTSTDHKVYELRECYILTDALLNSGQL